MMAPYGKQKISGTEAVNGYIIRRNKKCKEILCPDIETWVKESIHEQRD
jgi:hypothetical protein